MGLDVPRENLGDSGALMRLYMIFATNLLEICKDETRTTSVSATCPFPVANQSHGTFVSDRWTSPDGSRDDASL
eukprot:8020527-Pyramimonas_sp.AAC.1